MSSGEIMEMDRRLKLGGKPVYIEIDNMREGRRKDKWLGMRGYGAKSEDFKIRKERPVDIGKLRGVWINDSKGLKIS